MRYKLFFLFFALVLFTVFGLFFLLSDSYKRSLEAKVLYMRGDYAQAQLLAKEAHELDTYNRMAATIMAQSSLALEYVAYIEEGERFLAQIGTLLQKSHLDKADKIRIKFMADIMIERYPKLTKTVVIDETLIAKTNALFEEFKAIHARVDSTL